MKPWFLWIGALLIGLWFGIRSVDAGITALWCVPTTREHLEEKYGERIVGFGRTEIGDGIVALMVNPETGTWTVFLRDPRRGLSCTPLTGQDWTPVELGPSDGVGS